MTQHQNTLSIDPEIIRQATEWLVLMGHDNCTLEQQHAFAEWQQQSPQHLAAVEHMQSMVERLSYLNHAEHNNGSSQIIQYALAEKPKFKFEPNISYVLVLLTSVFILSLFWYVLPVNYWLADSRSSFNMWRHDTLADQSELKISGYSAYNLNFDRQHRRVELLNGNILVNVAKDVDRPFIVSTQFAEITALGTRFMIHQSNEQTVVTMLESKIKLYIKSQEKAYIVFAGQQVVIDKTGAITIKNIAPKIIEQAWDKHSLAVEDMPLDQVLDILQSYQPGKIYYQVQEIHDLKVTAILPLNQKDQGLNLLQDSLPIRITQPIPYVTIVHKK